MSGGVDSSTVAAMLRAEGYNVIGLTMQLWNQRRLAGHDGMRRTCAGTVLFDRRRVRCATGRRALGIPYYVVNQEERFEQRRSEAVRRRISFGTNADSVLLCNNHLKFDQLLITARQIGADLLATGHYAREHDDAERGRWLLKRPADRGEGSDVFSFRADAGTVSRTLFPLGEMHKPAVREVAKQHGLALADKPDSQEICFIPGGDYKNVPRCLPGGAGKRLPDTAGELVTSTGEVIGPHDGIHNFTVGQRKGLGVATGSPLVRDWNSAAISARLSSAAAKSCIRSTLRAHRLNWISIQELTEPIRVEAKIRHQPRGSGSDRSARRRR